MVWESHLLASKARVTPLTGLSIPRAEINGLLLAYRLMDVCLRACRNKPTTVCFLIDSSCVAAALVSVHGKLSPYLANRRGQIEEFSQIWNDKYPDISIQAIIMLQILAPRDSQLLLR